jgi:hypothetical protein
MNKTYLRACFARRRSPSGYDEESVRRLDYKLSSDCEQFCTFFSRYEEISPRQRCRH